ncbi:DNA internalization-related competence protein ComEC/Rec2 [Marinobacter sp. S6332]|uniref:DNA internalization-related competence protein ComEC/Rec2 n=1 Tax=Marinobacter sp. S6332 TaxID=2926403 RepID=UPI001FF56898|nr:DNA internalization-related competence protein ComEC/Rec2 [Marinobacter sp. S6332]MCK0164646.1 DNA internalization-related competence protein ComEC/Rec2 [Marinobacter sp. S6332]
MKLRRQGCRRRINSSGGHGLSGRSTVLSVFAFSCGVILLYRLAVLPAQVWLCLATVAAIFLLFPVRRMLPEACWPLIIGFTLGAFWAALWAHERLDQRLPDGLEGEKANVSGYVCSLPAAGSFNSIRFSFCVTRWYGVSLTQQANSSLPKTLRLAWYGLSETRLPDHRLRLEVVLKKPHGALNPAGFRYEDWLFRKGYRATGSVRSAASDPSVSCALECQYHRFHMQLADWVDEQFVKSSYHPLIASLLIGNRGHLSSEHWDVLKATGTIHLVAISGLHLGLVALGAGLIARRFLLVISSYRLSERFVRLAAFGVVLSCCLLYALAAGFTVPTRRALIMVAVGSWVLLKARHEPAWHSLVIALGLVLLLDPFAPLDQGFWLSFGAVSVLLCVFAGRLGGTGWLTGLLLAQGAVFAGLWPLLELVGQGQPVAGLLANIFAIPWVSLVVMPVLVVSGILVALFPPALDLAIALMDAVLGIIWGFLGWVAHMKWPDLNGNTIEIGGFAVLVLLIATVPIRAFQAVGLVVVLSWAAAAGLPSDAGNSRVAEPEVRVWDVGQGLSAMLRAGDEVLLYDTGPEVKGVFSAAESVLIPNLKALGVNRIDTLVISHADSDHSGGLNRVLEAFEVGRIVTGEPAAVREKLEQGAAVSVHGCAGKSLFGNEFSLFYWQATGDFKGNDASCVLSARQGQAAEWLFSGDISSRIEPLYLEAAEADTPDFKPRERIILAPHHGSKTSSSEVWVNELNPSLVIYTAGYRHRYGHPHKDVTARYRSVGARALNTACSGSLIMKVADGIVETTEARHKAPFWISGRGLARDRCKIP